MSKLTIKDRDGGQILLPTGLFIGNEFIESTSKATLDVFNPYSGELLGAISQACDRDIDAAVDAASTAFKNHWRSTPGAVRGQLLSRLADLIERDINLFATIHAVDGGFVFDDVKALDIRLAVSTLRHFSGWADKISGRVTDIENGTGVVRKEPLGVCGLIIPWNAPLMITCWKLAPAIAAGNVVVIKSPELAPLCAQRLAELVQEAGFPPGVINITCGLGHIAGQAMAEHMHIRKISFTGSTQIGRGILHAAASSNLKKVTLELGGKGPSIVFKDADLANAVVWTSIGASANNGQVCALGSRIYVHAEVYDQFVARFETMARHKATVAGNPLLENVTKGPIISKKQHKRIMSYIEKGKQEGASVLYGGDILSPGDVVHDMTQASGFIANTIFINVEENMTIVKDEIFGPVATIHRFSTEQEVVDKANASAYGLASAIFTSDIDRVRRVSSALESGQVMVNCWGTPAVNMPFGGIKESGVGRDLGEECLSDWTVSKAIYHWHLNDT